MPLKVDPATIPDYAKPPVGLVQKTLYPYMGIQYDRVRRFKNKKGTYHIFTYQAYNAMGLIGPEYNGIVIAQVQKPKGRILVDQIGREDTGYFGVSKAQYALWRSLAYELGWTDFQQFVNSHARRRDVI